MHRIAAVGALTALATLLPAAAGAAAVATPDPEALAGRCVSLRGAGAPADPLSFKATALGGRFLLHDAAGRFLARAGDGTLTRDGAPSAAAEWRIARSGRARYLVRSTSDDRPLAGPVRIVAATGCRRVPEAALGATGRPFRGTRRDGSVVGLADAHMHVTANLRAGGRVVSGETFDRFGVSEALGHDADVHGARGALDVTGNLLRDGVPLGFHDTDGWPAFTGWPTHDTNTHQQVYFRWLQRAWMGGLRLLVAQAVEDEALCRIEPLRSHSCDETETIGLEVRQLRELEAYVDAQSGGRGRGWLRLVEDPAQARRVIAGGRLAVLIGVESSNPFGCSEVLDVPQCDRADIDRGIAHLRRLGVRTIFPAHWVDNALAGAALEGGAKGVFISALQVTQTGTPFRTGPCPLAGQGEGEQGCNTRGLTDLGAYAIRRLMDAHMLIEMDHLSEPARERVLAIAEERGYPLVSSHTGTGGVWTDGELRRLYALGGIATATLDDAPALAAKVARLHGLAGARGGVALATDTGGFATLPGPPADAATHPLRYPFASAIPGVTLTRQRTGTRAFDLNRDGVAHYGLVPDLLADMARRPQGAAALRTLFGSAEAYLRTWERATRR